MAKITPLKRKKLPKLGNSKRGDATRRVYVRPHKRSGRGKTIGVVRTRGYYRSLPRN